uniref:Ig-like domain-containing protein n=1 Tax=Calidris pygmaea TaxID=425635 RepID=A0A8C3JLA5_9CHAR
MYTYVQCKGPFLTIICISSHFLFFSLTHAGAGVGSLIMQWPKVTLKRAGETVDISCYQNYTRLAYMYWYQQPPRHGLKLVSTRWAQRNESKGEVFLQLQNSVNNEKLDFGSGTKLTVIGTDDKIIPPSVAIFSPSKQEIQQKNKATLVCLASGFYPDHLNLFWKVNGAKRTEGVGTDEFSTQNGNEKTFSLTSLTEVDIGDVYSCSLVH